MNKPWSWKWKGGAKKTISLYFDNREIAKFGWFPPWQGPLSADNAKYMCRVLNAAFALGDNADELIEGMAQTKAECTPF